MRALAKKRWRELWLLRGPFAAIALVLMCGVATYVGSTEMIYALSGTETRFYAESRFADVFATLTRAPERLAGEIAAIPGVSAVETRIAATATLEVADFAEPVTGYLVSLPDEGEARLNVPFVLSGRLPEPGREGEVAVSDGFAEAHGLRAGSTLTALLNGRRERLTVVGVVTSPEYVYQVPPGALFPDYERFGILWMRREPLAAAYDLDGAFNSLALALGPAPPPTTSSAGSTRCWRPTAAPAPSGGRTSRRTTTSPRRSRSSAAWRWSCRSSSSASRASCSASSSRG